MLTAQRSFTKPREKMIGKVLRHAALLIEERGWCQRDWVDADGRLCIDAAVGYAEGGDIWDKDFYGGSKLTMDIVEDSLGETAISWNDEPGRTAEEVTAALRAAADAWDAA